LEICAEENSPAAAVGNLTKYENVRDCIIVISCICCLTMASLAWRHKKETCAAVAVAVLEGDSERKVARRFKKTRKFVRYHTAKFIDPLLHSGTIGGVRHVNFTDWEQLVLEVRALVLEFHLTAVRRRQFY
jgi:hypothetical protein